jgi:hypothetical protein
MSDYGIFTVTFFSDYATITTTIDVGIDADGVTDNQVEAMAAEFLKEMAGLDVYDGKLANVYGEVQSAVDDVVWSETNQRWEMVA